MQYMYINCRRVWAWDYNAMECSAVGKTPEFKAGSYPEDMFGIMKKSSVTMIVQHTHTPHSQYLHTCTQIRTSYTHTCQGVRPINPSITSSSSVKLRIKLNDYFITTICCTDTRNRDQNLIRAIFGPWSLDRIAERALILDCQLEVGRVWVESKDRTHLDLNLSSTNGCLDRLISLWSQSWAISTAGIYVTIPSLAMSYGSYH